MGEHTLTMATDRKDDIESVIICPHCGLDLVAGSQNGVRLDLGNRGPHAGRTVSEDADQGVNIEADIKVKVCLSCQWMAVAIDVNTYGGY